MSHIYLQKPSTMEIKKVPTGFSWTLFFFGVAVPIIRGDAFFSILYLITTLVLLFSPQLIILIGIIHLVMCFVYNSIYLESLEKSGWVRQRNVTVIN